MVFKTDTSTPNQASTSRARNSLQPATESEPPESPLRKTHSLENYGNKTTKKLRKKPAQPPIKEMDYSEDELQNVSATNKNIKVSKNESIRSDIRQHKSDSRRSSKSNVLKPGVHDNNRNSYAYDNSGFDETGSIRTSSRNPSVQSLSIVREQYCCCVRRTSCEKVLIAAVVILVLIVIVLIIVIIILATDKNGDNAKALRRILNSL